MFIQHTHTHTHTHTTQIHTMHARTHAHTHARTHALGYAAARAYPSKQTAVAPPEHRLRRFQSRQHAHCGLRTRSSLVHRTLPRALPLSEESVRCLVCAQWPRQRRDLVASHCGVDWMAMARLACERPRFCIGENVRNIVRQ
jgi:hypothetical protein